MVWHSCPSLYVTLLDKLWHLVQLKCLFMTIAKDFFFFSLMIVESQSINVMYMTVNSCLAVR